MRALIVALTLAAAGPAVAAPPSCHAIPGARALWAEPRTRFILVGELHGTRESPAFFADLACQAASSGRPVVVALERPEAEQPAIDAFMASNGDAAARSRFLASPMWRDMGFGLSSSAYLKLFERLRQMLLAGDVSAVVGFDPATYTQPITQSSINAAMADRLRAAASLRHDALVLGYMGSLHASKREVVGYGDHFTPAAADLPDLETVSLFIRADGIAWNCQGPQPSDCGPHATADEAPIRRQVLLDPALRPGYDGVVDLGVRVTASPPAVR